MEAVIIIVCLAVQAVQAMAGANRIERVEYVVNSLVITFTNGRQQE